MTYPTKVRKKYVDARAKGMTQEKAAAVAGISAPTAHLWETAEDCRQAIDTLAKQYISKLPDTIKLSHRIIDTANNLDGFSSDNYKIVELATKESAAIRQAVGITPMQTPSQIIVGALNIDARQVHVSGTVGELLRKHFTIDAAAGDITPPNADTADS
jgi:hypothetical protein